MKKKIDLVSLVSFVGMALTLVAKLVTDYADDAKQEEYIDKRIDEKFAELKKTE